MNTHPHLILVTPKPQHRIFHDWLSAEDGGMDKVHKISGREELMSRRLGGEKSNKRCYALVNDQGGLLSVIYTYWATTPAGDESWRILPGKVDKILAAKSEPLTKEPNIVTFYSISSFADRSGKPLISAIYDQFTRASKPPVLTTLSPLRTLREWLDRNDLSLEGTEDGRLQTVINYLKTKQDPVQKFHLGNGAQVGAIHFNANAKGTLDDTKGAGVMINYRYPRERERLAENIAITKEGGLPASFHLHRYIYE